MVLKVSVLPIVPCTGLRTETFLTALKETRNLIVFLKSLKTETFHTVLKASRHISQNLVSLRTERN